METRARPTSRGRARCVSVRMGRRWEQTAAGPRAGACRLRCVGRRCLAPVGKGRCKCACSTLFALRAKALQSGAPDHGVSREKAGFRNVSPIKGFPGAPGNGAAARFLARGTEIHAIPQTRRILIPPSLPRPPRAASAVLYKARLPAIAFRGEHPARECVQGPPFTLPVAASSPSHPAGRTAGSARTRSRVQTLENPFLGGTAHVFSRHPSPKPPQVAGPCSWACRRLPAPSPQTERTAADPPPARGAGLRHHGAKGTGWRPCRPCRPTKAGKSSLGRRAPKSLSSSRARRTQSRP